MNFPKGGSLTGGQTAARVGRGRRAARSVAQAARRLFGRGGVQDETVRDIVREGRRARTAGGRRGIFGRNR